MSETTRSQVFEALARLEGQLERPVVLVAAGWLQERGVNLDGVAARLLADVLHQIEGRPALALLARGGRASFADGARRLLTAHQVQTSCVLGELDGAASVLALCAPRLLLLAGTGLGSPGRGPLGRGGVGLNPRVVELLEAGWAQLPEPRRRQALQVAHQRLGRRELELAAHALVDQLASKRPPSAGVLSEALSVDRLGDELALGAAELAELGVDASWVSGEVAQAMWALREACEEHLSLKQRPRPRYTELVELGGEAEFEMATHEPGALLLSRQGGFVMELDTGSPDPDTGLLAGQWVEVEGVHPE